MLSLNKSRYINSFFDKCISHPDFPSDLKKQLEESTKSDSIPYNLLISCHEAVNSYKGSENYPPLWKLLVSTNVDLPTVKLPERNPELEKRIQKLKAQSATDEYNRMTSNMGTFGCHPIGKSHNSNDNSSWGADIRQINKQLIMFLNFVIIVGCAFAAGFKGADYIVPEKRNSFQIKMLFGVFVGSIVFFADLYFLLKNLMGAEAAQT